MVAYITLQRGVWYTDNMQYSQCCACCTRFVGLCEWDGSLLQTPVHHNDRGRL